ncbi:hypothetical protein, partial [Bacteroides gallinaceum]|uniref:hypothetical protein n=1 Tax=Bacteroides gallinaceum TaxID=1462571 RepID=UPI00195D9E99
SNIESKVDYLYEGKFPFSEKSKIIEFTDTTFSDGLLKNDGTIDTAQSTYETSDYIEKENWNWMIVSYLTTSSSFSDLCMYDSDKNFISPFKVFIQLRGKTVGLNIPNNVAYLRFSRQKSNPNTVRLYYGNYDSIIDELNNV